MRIQNIKLLIFPLVLSLQLSILGAANVQGQEFTAANITAPAGNTLTDAEIKTMLRDSIDTDKEAVGLVVGIVDERGTSVISHGKLDNGTDRDVDGDTLFEIGSITKVFTALLLQDMIERGEMKLDDPVQKYLPSSVKMPTYQGKEITLLHLATHTSGLPRDYDGELSAFLSHCTLHQAPGIRQEYSNLGMGLLGHVIALKAGKDYETLVVERICEPLGMDSTRITLPPELKARLAIGHGMPGHRVQGFGYSPLPGAGALHSTANDLLKFVSAYLGLTPSPLSSLMQKAEALHSLESGAKLRFAWFENGPIFEHNGGTTGYKSELAFDPQKRRGIVVLSNCANNSTIVPALWRPVLDGRSPKPADLAPMDPALYDRYAGQYQTDKHDICTVRREGGRLMLQWIGQPGQRERYPSFEVFPQSGSVFRNEFYGEQVMFFPAVDSQALRLILTNQASNFRVEMTRISTDVPAAPTPVQIDPRTYDGYVGQYRWTCFFKLIRVGPTLSISHETDELGDHLIMSVRGLPQHFACEIFPENETNFIPGLDLADDLRLTFIRNKQGKTKHGIVYWNGSKHRGTRISNEPAN